MDDLEFLRLKPAGQASLTVTFADGVISTIDYINLEVIEERCPLLALAFEPGPHGLKYSIEETSLPVVASFLRFLYLGDYSCFDTDGFPKPCSLLLHAQLCRMGEIYDVPELSSTAHVNIIHETQISCSYPEPPLELCEAIRFLYTKLPHQQPLIDTILHYCVSCFTQHRLDADEEFCRLVYELEPFHKDLFKMNYQRGFEDEGATSIVRLPSCKSQPLPDICRDFVYELFGCWPEDGQTTPKAISRRPTETDSSSDERPFCLVHRPRNPFSDSAAVSSSDSEASATEDEGFTLVYRPKQGKSQSHPKPDRHSRPRALRPFDPSTPCAPANPSPQKIIRGFQPLRQQNTTMQPFQPGSAHDAPRDVNQTLDDRIFELQQKLATVDSANNVSSTVHENSLNNNPFRDLPRSTYSQFGADGDPLLSASADLLLLPRSNSSFPKNSQTSPAFLSSRPQSKASLDKVKNPLATPATRAQTDAAKRAFNQLEETLRKDMEMEQNEPMPQRPLSREEELVDLGTDVEMKMGDGEGSNSDSEWSLL
ncbi:hypothetical protein EV356DRAFT_518368 [Viridothelium virens]|uniref:BTB domain-containing protein n=1 Tax=Viridothelium virens TaxID=1048519 RepID=A0A6A6H0P9_VIRVR|nr:hypothetical protein EV356DRAFT_518368 [Viridothelium virens]